MGKLRSRIRHVSLPTRAMVLIQKTEARLHSHCSTSKYPLILAYYTRCREGSGIAFSLSNTFTP